MKILSWNVKGLNSPQKRNKVFLFLERNQSDIVCLQESHIRTKDVKLIINKKLGKEYISSTNQSKRGVIFYIKNHIESKEILNDKDGRYLGIEIYWKDKKCFLLGIYGPQENKNRFYTALQKILMDLDYENILIMGDFNGVIQPKIDRSLGKHVKEAQGKLPKSFFGLMENWGMIEVWRHLYPKEKCFTFFSDRHQSLSRLDMFFTSQNLLLEVEKMEILNRTISDHNPITLNLNDGNRTNNWYLNEELLKDGKIVDEFKIMFRQFLKENKDKEVQLSTLWDVGKAVIRGFFPTMEYKNPTREKTEDNKT